MKIALIRPSARNLRVPEPLAPGRPRFLPPDGARRDIEDPYWARRLRHGEVVIVPESLAVPEESPTWPSGENV